MLQQSARNPALIDLGRAVAAVVVALSILATPTVHAQEAPPDPEPTTPPSSDTTVPPTSASTTVPTTVAPSTTAPATTLPPTDSTVEPGPETDLPTDPLPPDQVPAGLDPDRASILAQLRAEYEDVTEEELAFFERYLGAQALAEALGLEILNLDLDLADLEAELVAAQRQVDLAEQRLLSIRAELASANRDLGDAEALLRRRAVQAYINGGATQASSMAVLRVGNANELGTTLVYADAIVADQRSVIDGVLRARDRARAVEREALVAQREAEAIRDAIAEREDELRDRRDQQERVRLAAEEAARTNEELVVEASARRAEYEQRMAVITAVSDGISGTLAGLQFGQEVPAITTGIFLPPIRGGRITSPYGPRMHPIYGVARMHNGVDINGGTGTPIRAAGDGIVVIAESQGGYGLTVVIDHGNGLGTLYAHMSALAVRPGDVVRMGDVIGGVGSTGLSTGPHLHWEVRVFGAPVNPVPYLGPER